MTIFPTERRADRDQPPRFYVAGRLENAEEVKAIIERLTRWGWVCTYDWTTHGNVRAECEDDVTDEIRAQAHATCRNEVRGVRRADIVIMLLPAGRGAHVELGIALATRARLILAAPCAELLGYTTASTPFYHARHAEHVIGGAREVIIHLDGEDEDQEWTP
jgi:nucleoside 2-deoxyribosyltransferase